MRQADSPDPKQARAVDALASGADVAQAAEAARRPSASGLTMTPSFVAGLNRAQRERADRQRAAVRGLGADRRHHWGLGRRRWV
jgi:hypothetical protein